jgi:GNAT superfamily N-acetyltransferase
VFGASITSALVGMTTLHLWPNGTGGALPYALIENVVTASDCRNKGVGRAVMKVAIDAAWQANAYKIMLMTGQRPGAKGFYEALGFSDEDKSAMVLRRPDAA